MAVAPVRRGTADPRRRLIRLLETRPLASGQVLYLVRVGEQDLLMAGTNGGLSLLSTIDGLQVDEPVAQGAAASSSQAHGGSGPVRCAEHLLALWGTRSGACAPPAGAERD